MSEQKFILTLSGSLRKDSYNTQLAQSAAKAIEAKGAKAQVINMNDYALPLFSEDIEGAPLESLEALRTLFSQADGLLIASPEYNGSFSGALKNTIDWLSRPSKDGYQSPFNQMTVGLVAASPGGLGGIRGLSQLRELMGNLGSLIVPSQLAIGKAYEAFNEDGSLNNPVMQERFEGIVESLIELS